MITTPAFHSLLAALGRYENYVICMPRAACLNYDNTFPPPASSVVSALSHGGQRDGRNMEMAGNQGRVTTPQPPN